MSLRQFATIDGVISSARVGKILPTGDQVITAHEWVNQYKAPEWVITALEWVNQYEAPQRVNALEWVITTFEWVNQYEAPEWVNYNTAVKQVNEVSAPIQTTVAHVLIDGLAASTEVMECLYCFRANMGTWIKEKCYSICLCDCHVALCLSHDHHKITRFGLEISNCEI